MNKVLVLILLVVFQITNAQEFPEKTFKTDSARYYYDLQKKELALAKRLELIDKAIKFEKENFFLHNEKANIYNENKKYLEYENYLNRMMEIFPSKGEIDAQMGFYEEGLGNRKHADEYYESSIKKINDELKIEQNYQKIASLNFLKMLNLLFLGRKKEVQEIINNTKEKDAQEFLSNYFQGMENMSREKLYQFINTDLK